MPEPHWKVLRRRTIYDSPWVRLHRDDVRLPDGTVIDGHHVVDVPRPAVGVVPVAHDRRILLIQHYRFITDTTNWEIPGGGIDAGEEVLAAASRELLEESGHAAEHVEYLGHYFPSNGVSTQQFHVCVARDVRRVGEIIDTNEVMQTRLFDTAEVREMLQRNELHDGLTLTALLWYFARLSD
ncbi:MAG TPA: NUDIX hydrolase [Tepidisphaeraceae bacterium]|nr:NUDIX hydrolase [Tepidisphaeraceae bacterium]